MTSEFDDPDRIETVGAAELRPQLAEVLDQISLDGRPVAVTRYGRTVAWLITAERP